MTTTSRLLTLLSLLQTPREWPGSLLASRLEVSDRTVRRDIDRLREMGYRIQATMGPEGGYRLEAGSALPPLLFDDDQAIAVAIALKTAPTAGAGIGEAALRALGTVRQVMPSRLRYRLDELEVTTLETAGDAPPTDVSLDVLVTLAHTIHQRVVLRFDYDADEEVAGGVDGGADVVPGPPAAPRRVEPHHLATTRGRWYLVAWDLDRNDWRIFRADRIRPRTPQGPRFTARSVPGGDVDSFVAARFKGSDVNEWPCRGSVRLQLPARDARPFIGDATLTPIDGQTCILEAGAWSWGALAAWFGRFEAGMEVIEPPELGAAFAALAERFQRAAVADPRTPPTPSAA